MNILILYTNFGAGHKFVAKQLEELLNNNLSDANIYLENTKRLSSPRMTALIEKVYMNFFTKYASNYLVKSIYGLLFKMCNGIEFINYNFVQKTGEKKALEIIDEKDIDIVICTYPYYLDTNIPCIITLTDYGYFNCWNIKENDMYVINNKETIDDFIESEIEQEQLYYSKIPISEKFNLNNNSRSIKTVLFNLGARGQVKKKNLKKNIDELLKLDVNINIMCGKNEKLYDYLMTTYKSKVSKKKIRLYSFINDVYNVLDDSDIVVTKAGGISVSECIESEKPMIINLSQTLKGQEMANYDYVLNHDIGKGAPEKDLFEVIKDYINNDDEYVDLVVNIKKLKEELNSQKSIEDIVKENIWN